MTHRQRIIGLLALGGWCLLGAEETTKSGWDYTAALGGSLTRGNSESLAYSAQFLATYRDEDEDATYGLDYFFAEYSGFKTTDSINVFGTYNRNISKKLYLGLGGSLYTNSVADVDYRADLSAALGYYFIRDDRRLLSVELGGGYAWESKDGFSDAFVTYRAAQHFDYKFNDHLRLQQSAVLTPKATDPASYLFIFKAALDYRLGGRWNLRSGINHRVDLDPVPGRQKDDTIITLGFNYSLNGFLKLKEDRADERKTLKKEVEKKEGSPKGWLRNLALTTALTKGNSESYNLKVEYDSAFRGDDHEFFLKGGFQYAENDGNSTQNKVNASTRYNWKFDPRNYAGVGLGFLHDDAADLRYRFTPGLHAGRYVILNDYGGLSLEGGLAYTYEDRGGRTSGDLTLQAAQRLYWQISTHTYVTQEIAYDAPVNDLSEFNINSYLYLDTILNEWFHWRVGVEYYYNSTPAVGAKEGDLSLTSGVSFRF